MAFIECVGGGSSKSDNIENLLNWSGSATSGTITTNKDYKWIIFSGADAYPTTTTYRVNISSTTMNPEIDIVKSGSYSGGDRPTHCTGTTTIFKNVPTGTAINYSTTASASNTIVAYGIY